MLHLFNTSSFSLLVARNLPACATGKRFFCKRKKRTGKSRCFRARISQIGDGLSSGLREMRREERSVLPEIVCLWWRFCKQTGTVLFSVAVIFAKCKCLQYVDKLPYCIPVAGCSGQTQYLIRFIKTQDVWDDKDG